MWLWKPPDLYFLLFWNQLPIETVTKMKLQYFFRPVEIFHCVCMGRECWALEGEAALWFFESFPNKFLSTLQFSLFIHHSWSKCRKFCAGRRHVTMESNRRTLLALLIPTADRNWKKYLKYADGSLFVTCSVSHLFHTTNIKTTSMRSPDFYLSGDHNILPFGPTVFELQKKP